MRWSTWFTNHRTAYPSRVIAAPPADDGYRMHARVDRGRVQLLTRTGLDWSHRYRRTVEILGTLPAQTAYLDGELCALLPDGISSFSRLQAAMDEGHTDQLIFFAFDLLYLNGENLGPQPLVERKERLQGLLKRDVSGLRFSEHVVGGSSRASFPSGSIGRTPLATGAFGSNQNA